MRLAVDKIQTPEGDIDYSYNTSILVSSITSPGGVTRSFTYDTKGRTSTVTESIGTESNTITLHYDSKGRLEKKYFNASDYEQYYYNANGYLYKINFNNVKVWEQYGMDDYGRETRVSNGTDILTWDYDSYEMLSEIKAEYLSTTLMEYDYSFDVNTGNLNWRKNVLENKTENFAYDNLDRLTGVSTDASQSINYLNNNNNGNINYKSDAGTYEYNISGKPYQVSAITNIVDVDTAYQDIDYYWFEKVEKITQSGKTAEFDYNADFQRIRMVLKDDGSTTKTRYYFGSSVGRDVVGTTETDYYWIGGDAYTAVAVAKKTSSGTTVYNIFRDHLGTITSLKSSSGLDEYSFDSWGRRRDNETWNYTLSGEPALFAHRGFTAHEHLEDFNLINMNGRLYDPVVGRFLSPDPFVQAPGFTQSFNRYSYCLNNPLIYTDPSGKNFLGFLFRAIAGNYLMGVGDNWINKGMPIKDAFKATPIVAGTNFSPGNFTQQYNYGFSNPQVDAHNLVQHELKFEQRYDRWEATQRGRGSRNPRGIFGTNYEMGPIGIGINIELGLPEWIPYATHNIGFSLSVGFVADSKDNVHFYITERSPQKNNVSFTASPEFFFTFPTQKGRMIYNSDLRGSGFESGIALKYGLSIGTNSDITYRQWSFTGFGYGMDIGSGNWETYTKLHRIYGNE